SSQQRQTSSQPATASSSLQLVKAVGCSTPSTSTSCVSAASAERAAFVEYLHSRRCSHEFYNAQANDTAAVRDECHLAEDILNSFGCPDRKDIAAFMRELRALKADFSDPNLDALLEWGEDKNKKRQLERAPTETPRDERDMMRQSCTHVKNNEALHHEMCKVFRNALQNIVSRMSETFTAPQQQQAPTVQLRQAESSSSINSSLVAGPSPSSKTSSTGTIMRRSGTLKRQHAIVGEA
ncbi:unnamed protein product, partial [Amoebophrya sp. A25]